MKGDMNSGEASSKDCCLLLEFAANNDLTGFKQLVEDGAKVDEVGTWYCRKNGSTEMVLEQRTPVMIASLYGSLDVLNYILRCYTELGGDINRSCGSDGSTALHCAAGGGSPCAIETVSLLIDFGVDLNVCDAQGRSPADVIMVSPKLGPMKMALTRLLKGTESAPVTSSAKLSSRGLSIDVTDLTGDACLPDEESVFESAAQFNITGQPFSGDPEHIFVPSPYLFHEMASSSMLSSSPSSPKFLSKDPKVFEEGEEKIRDFMVDPSLPDIKNSIYATDEFRMFSFKIRPCSRAYSHDWTECPFVHPGENARRRDPRKYHYSCVPCPDFRKGVCRRGDACEYAHGVFECWLHPAQYRTRLCKDGINCTRRVCFFAHTTEELRPLYVSAGSTLPSPRTISSVDLSPSSQFRSTSPILTIPPFSPSRPSLNTLSTPPQSPLSSSSNQLGAAWAQSNNVSTLLPGVGYHTSRLRAALNAKDLSVEDLNGFSDFDTQHLNDLTQPSSQSLSTQIRLNAAIAAASGFGNPSRVGKFRNMGLAVSQSNLEDLFASETIPSPGSGVQEVDFLSQLTAQLHAHKSSQLHSQSQNLGQSQLAYAATQMQLQQSVVDCHLQDRIQLHSLPQASSFSMALPSTISFGLESEQQSCTSVPFTPSVAAIRSPLSKSDNRSQSSRDLGAGLVWSDWGSPTGKPEWGVHRDDLWKLRKSASFGCKRSEESDVPGVQKPIKEGPLDTNVAESPSEGTSNEHKEISDNALLNAWIEQLRLDQIAA